MDMSSAAAVKIDSKLEKSQAFDKAAHKCITENPELISWNARTLFSLNRLYSCCPFWETTCFLPFGLPKDQLEGHSTLSLPCFQCSPCLHSSATEEEATQDTYEGNESWTKGGEKGKLLVKGEETENCWGRTGLWPSRQEVKIRVAQARRLWHTEEWITGLGALKGN